MELRIKMLDAKSDFLLFVDERFSEKIATQISDYCCIHTRFEVFDKKENLVAEISAYFIDEFRSYNNGLSITTVADYMSQELLEAINSLVKAEDYEEIIFTPAYTCYIQTLYVYPEFRNKGIGKYLWENIADIFEYFMNKDIHAIIVYPKPHTIIKNGNTFEKKAIEDDEMLLKMKNGLISGGYKQIENSNYYVKIFLDE